MADNTYNVTFTGQWQLLYTNDTTSSVSIVLQNNDSVNACSFIWKSNATAPSANGIGFRLNPISFFPFVVVQIGDSFFVRGTPGKILIAASSSLLIGTIVE